MRYVLGAPDSVKTEECLGFFFLYVLLSNCVLSSVTMLMHYQALSVCTVSVHREQFNY